MPRLNHVSLTVADREVSAAFYGRYFGLTLRVHEDDHLLILSDTGGSLLALVEGEADTPVKRGTHFGFQVTNSADVVALRATFAADGITEAEWQESGVTRVQVFDPDGYRAEVFAF
ncbi:MAG: VOC family protein [Pseudomonadota bacterium]